MNDGDRGRMDAQPPSTTAEPPALRQLPSIVELGRQIRMLQRARNAWDEREVRAPQDTAERRDARVARDVLDLQRDALTDLVFARPAQTLADVLVQLDAASILVNRSMHNQLDADIVNQAFETLARVLASMSGVLIREAGVDATEVCDRFTLEAVASEFGALMPEGV